ncbi:MAG: hypothetical protein ABJK25_15890 [Halieaceae bacterium]
MSERNFSESAVLVSMSNLANQPPVDFQNSLLKDDEGKFRSGTNWFYWIAGLSILNSIAIYAGNDWVFIIGLGITQLTDGTAMHLAEIYPVEGNHFRTLSLVVDLLASAVFFVFGWLSNKRNSFAYLMGMGLYLGDGLIFLLVEDWMSIGFHVFAFYFMVSGYLALRNLREKESSDQSGQPQSGLGSPLLWVNTAMIMSVAIISLGMFSYTDSPWIVDDIASLEEFDAYTTYYYKTEQLVLVTRSMNFIDASNLLDDESTHGSIIAFYSEVYKQNPERAKEWIDAIDNMENRNSQIAFWTALWVSNVSAGTEYFRSRVEAENGETSEALNSYLSDTPPIIKNLTPDTPDDLDLHWYAFFASGDVDYVENIIDAALLYSQRIDQIAFYTGAAAKWSLSVNAPFHDPVSEALVAKRDESNGIVRSIIQDIIDKSEIPNGPQMILDDVDRVIEAEVAAGRWQEEQ